MAWEGPVIKAPNLKAAENLGTYQYTFVKLGAVGTVEHIDAASDRPIGVLQNNPAAGEEAEVVVFGITKIKANEVLAVGDSIKVGDGQVPLGMAAKAGNGATTPNLGTTLLGAPAIGAVATVTVNTLNQER